MDMIMALNDTRELGPGTRLLNVEMTDGKSRRSVFSTSVAARMSGR